MNSALDGITVPDLTDGMAGALATMFLCDNGARVIRLGSEASERKRQTPGYSVWDRCKESVFLDLYRKGVADDTVKQKAEVEVQ